MKDWLRLDGWDLTPVIGGLIFVAVLVLFFVVWGIGNA